jgi:hypothetical protein
MLLVMSFEICHGAGRHSRHNEVKDLLSRAFISDVSIYKSDFKRDFDYFHVIKFDFDFFDTRMHCYLTWLFSLNQFIKTYFSSTNCQLCQLQFT